MKQIHLLGVGILLSAIGLSGCSESNNGIASGYGTFSPLIGLDTEVLNSSASRAVQVSADDLSLKLTKPDGSVVTWDKVGDFDPTLSQVTTLPSGFVSFSDRSSALT